MFSINVNKYLPDDWFGLSTGKQAVLTNGNIFIEMDTNGCIKVTDKNRAILHNTNCIPSNLTKIEGLLPSEEVGK